MTAPIRKPNLVTNSPQLLCCLGLIKQTVAILPDNTVFERAIPTLRREEGLCRISKAAVAVVPRVCELVEAFQLGRKRVLDTALAATIDAAGVTRIATFNSSDFAVFAFLQVEDPSTD